jgi:uncharacterized protein
MVADFQIMKEKVLTMLTMHGNPVLTYHTPGHTKDVLRCCERIALEEGITSKKSLLLLKIAALYHDTGFLLAYRGHEEKSCLLARSDLASLEFAPEDIEKICSMIMATKIPQSPKNHLEEIICDADLDYLGRDDFETISNHLRNEFFKLGVVKTEEEWMQLQIGFFESHSYFTRSAREKRNFKKLKHLEQLKVQAGLSTTNKLI